MRYYYFESFHEYFMRFANYNYSPSFFFFAFMPTTHYAYYMYTWSLLSLFIIMGAPNERVQE